MFPVHVQVKEITTTDNDKCTHFDREQGETGERGDSSTEGGEGREVGGT